MTKESKHQRQARKQSSSIKDYTCRLCTLVEPHSPQPGCRRVMAPTSSHENSNTLIHIRTHINHSSTNDHPHLITQSHPVTSNKTSNYACPQSPAYINLPSFSFTPVIHSYFLYGADEGQPVPESSLLNINLSHLLIILIRDLTKIWQSEFRQMATR